MCIVRQVESLRTTKVWLKIAAELKVIRTTLTCKHKARIPLAPVKWNPVPCNLKEVDKRHPIFLSKKKMSLSGWKMKLRSYWREGKQNLKENRIPIWVYWTRRTMNSKALKLNNHLTAQFTRNVLWSKWIMTKKRSWRKLCRTNNNGGFFQLAKEIMVYNEHLVGIRSPPG